MQFFEPKHDFPHDVGRYPFWYLFHILVDDFSEASSVHELNKHEKTIHVVVRGMVVYDILVSTHRHHSSLDLDFVQDFLLRNFHDPDCPALVGIFTVKSLIYCTHSTFSQLFCKAIHLVRVVRQKLHSLYLFVELSVTQKSVVRNFFFFFKATDNLDHNLRIFFDEIFVDIVFGKQFHHVGGQSFDAAGTVEVNLQVHLVFKVWWPESKLKYLLMKTGCEFIRSMIELGRSSSGLTSLDKCLVLTVLFWSMFIGRS